MTDNMIGFISGSITTITGWILGLVSISQASEVFLIAVIGGFGGVIGSYIAKMICRRLNRKNQGK